MHACILYERGGFRGLRSSVGQPAGQRGGPLDVAGSSSERLGRVKMHPATRQVRRIGAHNDALDVHMYVRGVRMRVGNARGVIACLCHREEQQGRARSTSEISDCEQSWRYTRLRSRRSVDLG